MTKIIKLAGIILGLMVIADGIVNCYLYFAHVEVVGPKSTWSSILGPILIGIVIITMICLINSEIKKKVK